MCVIVFLKINNDIILAKNRDRNYKARIELIHELINGIEVAYIRDVDSEWTEGLNEYGFGIINSSLDIVYDENPLSKKPEDIKMKLQSQKKYLNALATKSFNIFQDNIFNPDYYYDISLQGHTFLGNPYYCIHCESNSNKKPYYDVLDDLTVYTNHGNRISNAGYIKGKALATSIIRQKLIEAELKDIDYNSNIDILDNMNKYYKDFHPEYHPYRMLTEAKCIYTTSQLLLNLTKKIMIFRHDKDHCDFIGVNNRLPDGYIPKIKIFIYQNQKNMINTKHKVDKKIIDDVFSKLII